MKNTFTILVAVILLAVSCFVSCSQDEPDTETNNNSVAGTINLSGEETAIFGTSLTVGTIAVNRTDLTNGVTNSIILLPENTTIRNDTVILEDPNNGFSILATDFSAATIDLGKTIGMVILKDNIKYTYFCDSPVTDGTGAIPCGADYKVDFIDQKVTFDSTTVVNVATRKILTLDGTVSWQ